MSGWWDSVKSVFTGRTGSNEPISPTAAAAEVSSKKQVSEMLMQRIAEKNSQILQLQREIETMEKAARQHSHAGDKERAKTVVKAVVRRRQLLQRAEGAKAGLVDQYEKLNAVADIKDDFEAQKSATRATAHMMSDLSPEEVDEVQAEAAQQAERMEELQMALASPGASWYSDPLVDDEAERMLEEWERNDQPAAGHHRLPSVPAAAAASSTPVAAAEEERALAM